MPLRMIPSLLDLPRVSLAIAVALNCFIGAAHAFGQSTDWPGWRGRSTSSTTEATGWIAWGVDYQLRVAWRRPLGIGYSSVSIAGGLAVTMFSDDVDDWVVAFDARAGDELWRYRVSPTHPGRDGSASGPLSTPYVTDEAVYALGSSGRFVALATDEGGELWSSHLAEDHGGRRPDYGFTTSPLAYGDVVVVQVGSDRAAAVAFDRRSGEIVWRTGRDRIDYQSPFLLSQDGQALLVAVGREQLHGIDPATGSTLWRYEHGGDDNVWYMSPAVVGDDRLFLPIKWDESALIQLRGSLRSPTIKPLWTRDATRGTYSVPVHVDGYLYEYNRQFLTCVDAATGRAVWKSRQPGDGFVSVVDAHLVIGTKVGGLHIAKANAEGYEEVVGRPLFAAPSWSPPSFANGLLYCRSFSEIACVELVRAPQTDSPEVARDDTMVSSAFAQSIASLDRAADKEPAIAEFIRAHPRFPIVEGDDIAHFVYYGEANDVAIVGGLIGDDYAAPMTRVRGTRLFHYSSHVEADARLSYRFVINGDKTLLDPRNPRTVPATTNLHGRDGEFSWFSMPAWQEAKHLTTDSGPSGSRLERRKFKSRVLGKARTVDVYLPPGYDTAETSYPVAYVHQGGLAQTRGMYRQTLDALVGRRISPVIAVFVHRAPDSGDSEYRHDARQSYTRMVAEQLVPFIDRRYRTQTSASARASIGMGVTGSLSLHLAFRYPDVFGKVASQSPLFLSIHEKELWSILPNAESVPMQIYLDWGKYGARSPLEGWDMAVESRKLRTLLEGRGYAPTGGEAHEAFSWESWRNRTDRIFEAFFPLHDDARQ
ncbi:PQQ-binding-like beta-propeller repeat protein [Candidatus Poribacteria bacterium]|nr:PQQ-binding-like beta-propeller repeat protein [Candidatus Poribacteria bacterium]